MLDRLSVWGEWLLSWLEWVLAWLAWGVTALALSLLLSRSVYVANDTASKARAYLRAVEFDFADWTAEAVAVKLRQSSVGAQSYVDEPARAGVVRTYFDQRRDLERVEADIARQYADPSVTDPAEATADLSTQQAALRGQLRRLQPVAEAILQEQLSVILAEQSLVTGGQPVPPVAFHLTPLPYAVIVSPREVIRQDANVDVNGDLTLPQQVGLEDQIAHALDVSTLIVPLGGIGTYPTMVGESSDLNWITSVVAHEWTHNYLTLRPLGINYAASPELRTMNETTAEMMGDALGALLMRRYYPDLAPPPPPFTNKLRRNTARPPNQAPAFDFRAQMHTTRVTVDRLLAQGQIAGAEEYMEMRRRFFWDHGYQIRKLNQAYFAFYGAYAEGGGGAAGADPVGTAVRLLRRRSSSLADFVNTMAVFTTFDQLRRYLGLPPS